uniref:Secreted protein n=1 Tax=Plectus sambesii TaxID=2011161 RepID=A0A914W1P4_9BILA
MRPHCRPSVPLIGRSVAPPVVVVVVVVVVYCSDSVRIAGAYRESELPASRSSLFPRRRRQIESTGPRSTFN